MQQTVDNNIYPICPNCGVPIDYGALFCGYCGSDTSSSAKDISENNWKENTLGFCPSCGKPMPLDRNYCILCGQKLHEPADQGIQIEKYREALKSLRIGHKDNRELYAACHYCNKLLDESASFCGYCGAFAYQNDKFLPRSEMWKAEALELCPYCSQIVPSERRYCILCGGPLHLLKEQVDTVKVNRSRRVKCSISFNITELSEHDIEMFYLYLYRNRTLSDKFVAEQNGAVKCEFSIAYDEPAEIFHIGVLTNMVRLLLEDAAKQFPKLKATAYCDYNPTYIAKSRLNFFDDLGGFVSIELSGGIVTVDDTPYM